MSNSRFGNRTRTGNVESFMQPVSPGTFLLDIYPDAIGAYSLRKLRTAYQGPAIRVRRSNDDAESDIGFDSFGFLDISALSNFVGGNSGLVTTWYDQSKNSNNLLQATGTQQPRIVNSGTVDRLAGSNRPTLIFDGSNDSLQSSTLINNSPLSIFVVNRLDDASSNVRPLFDSVDSTQAIFLKLDTQNILMAFGGEVTSGTTANTNTVLYSIMQAPNSNNSFRNSTTQFYTNTNLGSNGFTGLRLGTTRGASFLYWSGAITEFIVYSSDQSSNRTTIDRNINNYYILY